ncbi:MAG TPA: hypothetical protein VFW38_12315 [Solirubrobacteraceae bacterium]|nr:hypothetical protein [Solirubrobacteraceae bacterium]
MATRAIVTSHPVVACDVCGRRLLRGETPDVFVTGGHRRTVCELCIPRATAEGWRREADGHDLGLRRTRPRRAGSLLGRLRQLRESQDAAAAGVARSARRRSADEREALYEDDGDLYDFLEAPAEDEEGEQPPSHDQAVFIGAVRAEQENLAELPTANESLAVERALAVFNAGETPQRVAGVSRSLGAPTVVARELQDGTTRVAIVVAWELCWYRYEVDLADEPAGVRVAAEGMELEELPAEDRLANAAADERGELALLAV